MGTTLSMEGKSGGQLAAEARVRRLNSVDGVAGALKGNDVWWGAVV